MPSPAFGSFFEIFSEGVVLTVSSITTVAFGERCLRNAAPLNLSGLVASLLAVFYSIFGLTYWFNGIQGYECTALAAVNGTCMSASNALTFLHLFIKARASNKQNPMWRYWNAVGVSMTVFNWATLVVVHALLTGTEVDGIDGRRCKFSFELTSFKLKWLAQFANQLFQVVAFTWPLRKHISLMRYSRGGFADSGPNADLFATLVRRAVLASAVSLVFTAVITGLAFTKIHEMENNTNDLIIPVFPLAVLDNAINLGAIFFAVNVSLRPKTQAVGPTDDPSPMEDVDQNCSSTDEGWQAGPGRRSWKMGNGLLHSEGVKKPTPAYTQGLV